MPGKAAAFDKPILVASGHLMGQRVLQYDIGMTVDENDVSAMQAALVALVNQSPRRQAQFDAYRKDFSSDALGQHLMKFLTDCMHKPT